MVLFLQWSPVSVPFTMIMREMRGTQDRDLNSLWRTQGGFCSLPSSRGTSELLTLLHWGVTSICFKEGTLDFQAAWKAWDVLWGVRMTLGCVVLSLLLKSAWWQVDFFCFCHFWLPCTSGCSCFLQLNMRAQISFNFEVIRSRFQIFRLHQLLSSCSWKLLNQQKPQMELFFSDEAETFKFGFLTLNCWSF